MIEIVKDTRVLHIRLFPTEKGIPIKLEADQMLEALSFYSNAHAIAANQLGFNIRAFVMKLDTLTNIFIVNPMITKSVGKGGGFEECLSLPELRYKVKRPKKVVVQGFNEDWQPVKYRFHELSARIVCHEIDHLDGKLISDVGERA